jgi:hypothetical protein
MTIRLIVIELGKFTVSPLKSGPDFSGLCSDHELLKICRPQSRPLTPKTQITTTTISVFMPRLPDCATGATHAEAMPAPKNVSGYES